VTETSIRVAALRIPRHRISSGSCLDLGRSLRDEGQRRPVAVWRDGTLISGERRAFAAMLLEIPRLQAVYVSTIEDAAKHLMLDNQDVHLAAPMKWSEVCKLWQTLRRLDEPAAIKRREAARRRGVDLRRQTQSGKRLPGRSQARTDDYVLSVICEPFAVSVATAARVEYIYRTATGLMEVSDEKRALAKRLMADLDDGAPVWPAHQKLRGDELAARPSPIRRASAPVDSAPAAKQLSAWARAVPQMEGLISGLVELGPPHPDLTWGQVGPVHASFSAIRREMEKIIKKMREIEK